jgi:hypothetical protein
MNKIYEGQVIGIGYASVTFLCTILPIGAQETLLLMACIFWIGYWAILLQQIKILKNSPTQVQA